MEKIDVAKKYNLPSEVRFCKKCTISNQRPRIVFDDEGVCYACRYAHYKYNEVDWDMRRKELRDLCDRHRRTDGQFDVIVPSSGGKDSAFVAHILKNGFGMHPITITWAPHIYTDIGRQNFEGLVHAGLDNITGTPNGIVHRKLTKMATIELGDPFQPFIYGQVLFPLRMAIQMGIKLIFSGENGEAEYSGNPEAWDNRGFNIDEYDKWWFSNMPIEHWLDKGFSRDDLAMYLPPERDAILASDIERHFFGYYHKWVPQENFYYASANTGFKSNPEGRSIGTYSKYASIDDEIDPFHYYFMFLKFGVGRATSDASRDIRDGHITREEGVALVNRYDDEISKPALRVFLDYCNFAEEEFWETVERWRNAALWEREDNQWSLKHRVE